MPAADTAFHGTLRDAEDVGDLAVIHILQIAENDGFPQLRVYLRKRSLHLCAQLQPGNMLFLTGTAVGKPFGAGLALAFLPYGLVQRFAGTLQP